MLTPLAHCKSHIQRESLRLEQLVGTSESTCYLARNLRPSYDKRRTYSQLRFNRNKIRRGISERTGHCVIGTHGGRMGLELKDYQRSCGRGNCVSFSVLVSENKGP